MDRDLLCLEALARFRFLSSTQLHELVGGSRQKLAKRLQQMFHHGYVDRPLVQMDLWRSGSSDLVYSVTRDGVARLREAGRIESPQLSLSVKSAPKRSAHILHTLGISSFYMSLLRHAEEHDVAIDWWPESLALRDRVRIAVHGKRRPYPIFPDAFFKLTIAGRGGLRAFLEVDMGTEPIERGTRTDITAEGSDVAKKLRAYWQWGYVDKQHRGHPIYREHAPKGFVVLLATNSAERAQSILALADNSFRENALPRTDMFWVASFDPHSKHSLYDVEWQTFKGTARRLLDRA
jgi:hypothetical protein